MSFQKKGPKKFTNSDRALEHFDLHYKPFYKDKWPSIRISLLTAKKTCAVMNNFAENSKYIDDFKHKGAYDIVERAKARQLENVSEDNANVNDDCTSELENMPGNELSIGDKIAGKKIENSELRFEKTEESDTSLDNDRVQEVLNEPDEQFIELNKVADMKITGLDFDRTDLHNFMPVETVYSETVNLRIEEAKRSVYTPSDVKVDIVKPRMINLPEDLQVIGFPSGDITEFPDVKIDKPDGHLCKNLFVNLRLV
jgi:hypothetical protein